MVFVFGLLGLVYLFFLISAFSFDPRKKYYNKILAPRTFIIHFSFAMAYATIFWFIYHRLFLFSAPAFALGSLFLLNRPVKRRYDRNIYLVIKSDLVPKNSYKAEKYVAVVIMFFAILGPAVIEAVCGIDLGPIK